MPLDPDTNIRRAPSGQPGCERVSSAPAAGAGAGPAFTRCRRSVCSLAWIGAVEAHARRLTGEAKDRRASNRSVFDPNFPMLAAVPGHSDDRACFIELISCSTRFYIQFTVVFNFLIIVTRRPFAADAPELRWVAGESLGLWAEARPNLSRIVSLLRPLWRRHAIINGHSQQSTLLLLRLYNL